MKTLNKKIINDFLFLLIIFFIGNKSIGQNCNIECTELIKNTTCMIDPLGGWPLSNNSLPMNAFYHKLVPNWFSSHGTPSILQYDGNGNFTTVFTMPKGTEKNFLALADSSNPNAEGIFQNVTLINDPYIKYNIYLKCKNIWVSDLDPDGLPNHLMSVFVASNLINYSNPPHYPQNVPNKRIGSLHMNVFNESLEINIPFNLEVNENYNQIWIYTEHYMNQLVKEEGTTIETVNLSCNTTALTDIITTAEGKKIEFEAENASNTSTFVEYSWDFGDGNTSTEANPTHTYENYGTYTVCLKVKDENGCCGEFCKEIIIIPPPHSCDNHSSCISIGIPGGTVYLSDLLAGPNPVIPSSQTNQFPFYGVYLVENNCFSCEGNLILDVPLMMNNTYWYMGAGASIEQTNWLFYCQNSVFKGCDIMWKGIISPDNGMYKNTAFYRCTIQDACIGVEVGNNNHFGAGQTNFYDNFIGVYLGKESEVADISNIFKSNKFENVNGLLEAYAYQPGWYSSSFIGIKIKNLALLNLNTSVTERNNFKNLYCGILGENSNIDVSGAMFSNTENKGTGGIILNPSGASTNIKNDNVFENLKNSIKIIGGNVPRITIEYNDFIINRNIPSIYPIGISIANTNASSISIKNKNDFNFTNGRFIDIDGYPVKVDIDDNDFSTSGFLIYPITIDNAKSENYFTNNRFHFKDSGYAWDMVSLRDCKNFSAENNIFDDNQVNGSHSGFYLSGTYNSLFKNNKIYYPCNGFYVSGSEIVNSNGFCCNLATNSSSNQSSFNFFNENGQTYFRQNDLKKLTLPGNFGIQYNAGNNWLGANNTANLVNGDVERAFINQFKVDQFYPNGRPSNILPYNIAHIWFDNFGYHPTCAERPDCNIPPLFKRPENLDPPVYPDCEEIEEAYNRLIKIKAGNPDNESELAHYQLESMMMQWTNLFGSQFLKDCLHGVTVINDPDIKTWEEVDSSITDIMLLDDTDITVLNELYEQIEQYLSLIDQNEAQQFENPDHQFIIYFNQIANIANAYNQIKTSVEGKIRQKAVSLIPEINSLNNIMTFMPDKKKVWLIKMSILANGFQSITGREWEDIRTIAMKCPDTIGQAVFQAQSLLQLLDEYIVSDGDCSDISPRSSNINHQSKISIFPNPGSEYFDFKIGEQNKANKLKIVSLDNKVVLSKDVSGKISDRINISKLNSGIYIVKFENDGEIIGSEKLVIVR